jgi:hypothetical protein
MKNIKFDIKDGKLIITINLEEEGEPSKSGKNLLIASSKGNVDVPGTNLKLGLNLYKSYEK